MVGEGGGGRLCGGREWEGRGDWVGVVWWARVGGDWCIEER